MRRKAGKQYGYWALFGAAVLHMPLLRLLIRPDTRDNGHDPRLPEFCSQAVASADRVGGGVDPVPNISSNGTRGLKWLGSGVVGDDQLIESM